MVNRPDSSSTRSDKSSSSSSKSMHKNNGRSGGSVTTFVRSKSGNDYVTNRLRNASSMQSINSKSGDKNNRGALRKFRSNGR